MTPNPLLARIEAAASAGGVTCPASRALTAYAADMLNGPTIVGAERATDILILVAALYEARVEIARKEKETSARIAVLLNLIEAAKAELAFTAIDEADGSATDQTRPVRLKSIAAALEGVGNIEARRALGFLPPATGQEDAP